MKNIITHEMGQYLFPGDITGIEGGNTDINGVASTTIDMRNMPNTMIGVTPYGATVLNPNDMKNSIGNYVLEIPTAQMGGSAQQKVQQLISIYAQMVGQDPNKLMQEFMALPKEQQQQSITAIANKVQEAMQQQQMQQQMGLPEQGGMDPGMMARDGGCMDCEEQFPQAQNLNWFYKAQGGEAFPQANMYPESWAGYSGEQYAQGGEAFPQAQTYLPYMRKGETKPNFMFEYGGETDIHQAYQMMKKGGFDMDPKKKRGGKFNEQSFADYVAQNGGMMDYETPYKGTRTQPVGAVGLGDYMNLVGPQETTGLRGFGNLVKSVLDVGSVARNAVRGWGKVPGLFVNEEKREQRREERAERRGEEYMGYKYGAQLPKHQMKGKVYDWSSQSLFNSFMPQPMVEQQGWDTYSKSNPMRSYESYLGSNQTTNTAGQPVSFKPGSSADPSTINYQQPGSGDFKKVIKKTTFNDPMTTALKASQDVAKLSGAANFFNELLVTGPQEEERRKKINTTDYKVPVNTQMNLGNYMVNPGTGEPFKPNEQAFAQDIGTPVMPQMPLYTNNSAKRGGSIFNTYQDGGVYDLTMDEIRRIYEEGGEIEFLED